MTPGYIDFVPAVDDVVEDAVVAFSFYEVCSVAEENKFR